MKTMKLSAIVLGLAAASAFAQAAPAAAAPAAEAAKAQPAAQPATDSAAVAAEQAKAAEEAKKAEEAKAAEEAKKAEEAKAAEDAKKAEEAKKAEQAKAEEKSGDQSSTTFAGLNITKADEAPEAKKAMEFKVSGQAEFDTYANMTMGDDKRLYHDYWSTLDVDFEVKFNENWSAQVELEADGASENPGAYYSGAFIQYQNGDAFTIKAGDLTFSEGAFNYYDYNDPADYAAGMKEHDIRGLELDWLGLQLGLGFSRGGNDKSYCYDIVDEDGNNVVCKGNTAYDAHVAYQLDVAGQSLRPFAHYKSWQTKKSNEVHAGLEAALEFGPFAIHAVYGLHMDNWTEDDPKATHAILAEPSFKVSNVNIKAGFFYAMFDDKNPTVHDEELPEYMFAYGEGDISLTDALTIGIVGELHTNSLDKDADLGSLNFGPRFYFTPVDGLDITAFALAVLPMGNDWEKENYGGHKVSPESHDYGEDMNLKFGVETVFSF